MTLLNISAEDAEEYSESLAQIGEGWWRQLAWAFRQGIPDALGMSRRQWALTYHGYMRLPTDERQEAVKELAADGLTQPQIADALGINQATVSRDLNGRVGSDMPGHTIAPDPASPVLVTALPQESDMPVHINDGDEWYTPRWLFDALSIRFDADVCAPLDRTHSSVPTDRHYTIDDDGLAQHWRGTVWCNPPYSQPEPWARRMIHHGDGLLLTHIPMNAGWCVDVWDTCDAIRLFQAMEFVRPDGTSQRPGYWLQLAAFGATATEGLGRIQPLGQAAYNRRRVASPMWRRA